MQTGTVSRLRFAGDLEDSKSTSSGTLCIFVSHTFVPISLDAGLRLDGIPALDSWDLIVAVLHGKTYQSKSSTERPVYEPT